MTPAELIQHYEDDINYDAHGLIIRMCRSDACKEMCKRGKSVLGAIADHLTKVNHNPESDIGYAWSWALGAISNAIRVKDTPLKYRDISAWIAWARKHQETVPANVSDTSSGSAVVTS